VRIGRSAQSREVCFITQRPATAGDTVQRQTQRWLVGQGFDLPSVLVIAGSRGAAAGALRLDYHVDDSPTNCIDVKSESGARPVLIVPDAHAATIESARKLGIGSTRTITEDRVYRHARAACDPGRNTCEGRRADWVVRLVAFLSRDVFQSTCSGRG